MRRLSALALLLLASASQAHYHMLIPDKPSAKKGEEVSVICQFGHPFESELSTMFAPQEMILIGPGGKRTDVTKNLEKVSLKGIKGKVDGYRLKFTPDQRGDYVIEMTSAPTALPDTKETIQDSVRVVVHVQAQKGWDRESSEGFWGMPMTRPYGLLPNAVFQAKYAVTHERRAKGEREGKEGREPWPVSNILVEVERYNPTPPKELPADEFITRTMKTDFYGVVTTNLPEAGWWCLTATRRAAAKANIDGKGVEVTRRATLWVYVDKSAPTKPTE